MNILKTTLKKLFWHFGYTISEKVEQDLAVELENIDYDLIYYVLDSGYSMTNLPRMINTLKSCRYAVENNIPGDFLEVGVWRGGNGILARKIFEILNSEKKVWMFDTFEGMTAPTGVDVIAKTKISAQSKYSKVQNNWCFASLEDVKNNCLDSQLDLKFFKFIKGDVLETLLIDENIPDSICVLRLDTDWYESTRLELEILYPLLSKHGVLIVDDYGHWEGARKAVDEYFLKSSFKPLLNVVDYSCRSLIKV